MGRKKYYRDGQGAPATSRSTTVLFIALQGNQTCPIVDLMSLALSANPKVSEIFGGASPLLSFLGEGISLPSPGCFGVGLLPIAPSASLVPSDLF